MWKCPKCGEESEDQFDACWKCNADKPGLSRPDQAARPERQWQGTSEKGRSEPRYLVAITKRYENAYVLAKALVGSGDIIKGVGIVVGLLIAVVSIAAAEQGSPIIGVVGVAIGIGMAIAFYAFGVLIAAIGEVLKATLDTITASILTNSFPACRRRPSMA